VTDRLKELFEEAIELAAGDRPGFVALACSDDQRLRDQLLQLLRAHERAGDFLEHPIDLVEDAARGDDDQGDGLEPGQRIGNFTLRSCIGRGGFGSVWRATQEQPVARDVALKVLHAGFEEAGQALRFLAECRTLARMQHPSIAKVFDAGTEDTGRRWLAMELVDGRPVTHYCADEALGWRDRVELLIEVCLAVQHAHSKGIVHRDLKPSNVLVATRDGRAQPVVIDFGVARDLALEDRGGDAGQVQPLGTLDYMSPEQTVLDGAEVDTRTDVYSLGVLLYELAAGARPFEKSDGSYDPRALLRRIREVEPAPPSERDEALRGLPREVDWIAARAMTKDPAERYETAAALADDLRRLLAGEPVIARQVGSFYRFAKLVRRHAASAGLALATIVSLVIGTFVALQGWREAAEGATRARQAEQKAREAELLARGAEQQAREDQLAAERESRKAKRAMDLLDELWESADPTRFGDADYQVRELFTHFERDLPNRVAGEPAVELRVRLTLGRIQRLLGMLDSADKHSLRAAELARADEDKQVASDCLLERSRTLFDRGEIAAAEASVREAIDLQKDLKPDDARHATLLETLANCRQRRGDPGDALDLATEALELRQISCGPEIVARSRLQLANLHGSVGRIDVAMSHLQQALDAFRSQGVEHPEAITALQHLAMLQQREGDFASAEASYRESLHRRRELYGDDHPLVRWAEVDLAWVLHERGRDDEAVPLLRRALPALRERLGERHLYVSETMQRLGTALVELGQHEEAGQLLVEAAARYRTLPGHPIDGLVGCLGNLSSQQWASGDRGLACETLEEAIAIAERELPADHFVVSVSLTNLAYMRVERGEHERAIELLEDALRRSTAAGRRGEAAVQRRRLEDLKNR
jgi:non-specific serine/threonine protein kinase/serine/threonine-protein kinase